MKDSSLHEKLVAIQSELKVPKGQKNNFGGYYYRSIEDIETALKPLLEAYGLTLTFRDEQTTAGGEGNYRYYIQSSATLSDGKDSIVSIGFAREADSQKGMAEAQLTGSTSSYARKYAAGGLFLIDDTKDADATNDHGKKSNPKLPVGDKLTTTSKPMKDYTEEEIMDIFTPDDKPVKAEQVDRAYDNSGFPASQKQIEYIQGMGVKIGKRSDYLNEYYGIEWPAVSNKLAKVIIEDFKAEYDNIYKGRG